jgi:hypothetical protein
LYIQAWKIVAELQQGVDVGLISIRVSFVDVQAESDVTEHIFERKSHDLWLDKCIEILVDLVTHDLDGGVSKTYRHILGADLSTGMCEIE